MTQEKGCSVEGCCEKHKARGLCNKHYQRLKTTGTLETKRDTTVWKKAGGVCEFENCSGEAVIAGLCSNHYKQKQKYGAPGRKLFDNSGECSVDGCKKQACSKGMCRIHYYRVTKNGDPNKTLKTRNEGFCKICGLKTAIKRGMCRGCYQTWAYSNIETYRESGNNTQRQRKAAKKNVDSEKYTTKQVYDKNKGVCALCGGEINFELKFPHPDSFTIDHTIPLSKGGSNNFNNIMPAHYSCNRKKGNRI